MTKKKFIKDDRSSDEIEASKLQDKLEKRVIDKHTKMSGFRSDIDRSNVLGRIKLDDFVSGMSDKQMRKLKKKLNK